MSLSRVYMAAARTLWFSFHLGCRRWAVSLSALNVSPPTQTLPQCGDWTPVSVPPHRMAGPVLVTLLFSPLVPSSYQILHDSIFLSAGQVLLSALSWCSECTSMSEDVFLMNPWREMYSMSTYFSTILFSSMLFLIGKYEQSHQLPLQIMHSTSYLLILL